VQSHLGEHTQTFVVNMGPITGAPSTLPYPLLSFFPFPSTSPLFSRF
jgi:hypothetical protein